MSLSESSGVPYKRQLHRRLNSCSDAEPEYPQSSTGVSAHLRSKTERLQHPLGKDLRINSSTVTRPNLAKAMKDGIQHDGYGTHHKGKGKAEDYEETIRQDTERAVIVHEVTPTDSLAGIALKYGLSVAELCRANGMWPKDPIHLRKVLYIPLDKSAKYMLEPLLDLSEEAEGAGGMTTDRKQSAIKRIPEWKLSFFPPPSSSKFSESSRSPTLKYQRYPRVNTPSNSSSLPQHSLSNLFSSIPIVARLSFDSTATSSDDAELELDHVRPGHQHTHTSIEYTHQHTIPSHKPEAPVKWGPAVQRSPSIPIFHSPSAVPIRTVQLAPQPEMSLPLASRTRSKALTVAQASTEVSSV